MLCPKCGNKAVIFDVRNDTEENEVYRHHKCTNTECNNIFFSIEFQVEEDENFIKKWRSMSRGRKHNE